MKRRLTDKILDALETAWDQGREELAKRLDLIHETLVEEETGIRVRRRAVDDEFDAEDPDSFLRHKNFQQEDSEQADENPNDADTDQQDNNNR